MRAYLIFIAFALLTTTLAVKAQLSDLPACSEAELQRAHDIMPGIQELFDLAAEVRTLDDVRAYGRAHIAWREQLWTSTTPCAEAFEMALLSNQLTADYLASLLVNARRESSQVNPYQAWQFEGAERFEALWNALPPPTQVDEAAEEAPSAGTLRACTDAEGREVYDTLLVEYSDLTTIANEVETFEDFLNFTEAHLEWRQTSLTRYPPCAEAIEVAWLASQTASDIAALFAFHFVGIPVEAIPYSEPERHGTRRLRALDMALRGSPESNEDPVSAEVEAEPGALPDEVMRAIERELGSPSGGNWRRCTVGELETIQHLLPTYQLLEDMAAGIKTTDDLIAYSQTQIAWRENLLTKLARCGEVLEIAWLISENIGDLAIMHALKFLDVPANESPVFQQVMSNIPGINTWEGLLPSLLASYEARDDISPLPACTAEELGTLKVTLSTHLRVFKDHGDIRSADDWLEFVLQQIAWREIGFSHLPLCYGSFETFLRAYWFASDNAIHSALVFAGAPADSSPFPEQFAINEAHIESWYAIVEGVVAPPSADDAEATEQ